MITFDEIKSYAVKTINDEIDELKNLTDFIDDDFASAVETILSSSGRVVITGIGKSAIIGRKIVATLNSTGTPALFMHAADAIHGDIGMIRKEDNVVCISKSGNTPEVKVLVPLVKPMINKLIAIVGNTDSYLANQADFVLNSTVSKEACPNNLAPTSSTTAQLVIGDALSVALLRCRDFNSGDFARFHPGGALGKKLYMRTSDLYPFNEKPEVSEDTSIEDVILEITTKRLGATAVTKNGKVTGIITDGDLRRMLINKDKTKQNSAASIMSKNPFTLSGDVLIVNALNLMRSNNITQLLIVDNDEYKGIIHLHDILKEGII